MKLAPDKDESTDLCNKLVIQQSLLFDFYVSTVLFMSSLLEFVR